MTIHGSTGKTMENQSAAIELMKTLNPEPAALAVPGAAYVDVVMVPSGVL
jgi:hypothetical protein